MQHDFVGQSMLASDFKCRRSPRMPILKMIRRLHLHHVETDTRRCDPRRLERKRFHVLKMRRQKCRRAFVVQIRRQTQYERRRMFRIRAAKWLVEQIQRTRIRFGQGM